MRARARVDEEPDLPNGYSLSCSGQYVERAKDKLTYVLPLTLAIIALLLYLNFRSLVEVGILMLTLLVLPAIFLLWKRNAPD